MDVPEQLAELKVRALQELADIDDAKELESWRVQYLGKKSELVQVLRNLATLPIEERKVVGARANEVKANLEDGLKQKEQAIREAQLALAEGEAIDVPLPGRKQVKSCPGCPEQRNALSRRR